MEKLSIPSSLLSPAPSLGNLQGRLLVASPVLAETPFAQTIIYMCLHAPEAGAMGLVVNRPLHHPTAPELLKQLDITPNPPLTPFLMGAGGPVELGQGFVLHSPGWAPGARGGTISLPAVGPEEGSPSNPSSSAGPTASPALGEALAPVAELSANLDILRDLANGNGPRKAVMFLGHAAWEPGQLEEEILHGNAWYVIPATEELVFSPNQGRKWSSALAMAGLDAAALTAQVGEA
ncbi:hypothetical protein E3E12_04845 [Formicincola oecophyllae]|uniref:UPF0301 protein E3E12_04845 n=1 Tax=Formicincola oecophyllae TaxID=2558361 RepID=A0A4Y6UAM4_9PROT|nr:YqgE/AlgH family protein [Formicincola oecophyllae]QDH13628.1 hypothetical protein E3E12_04845 [Formicincola oecophyllae]